MTTHVALVRHYQTGAIEPASRGGVRIVGTPVELEAAFGRALVMTADRVHHVGPRDEVLTVADWLAS